MGKCVQVCEHHHNHNTGNFHHPNKFPCSSLLESVLSPKYKPRQALHPSALQYCLFQNMLDHAYLACITYMVTHMVTLLSFLLQPFLHVSVFTMHLLQKDIVGFCFCIQSVNLRHLIGVFSPHSHLQVLIWFDLGLPLSCFSSVCFVSFLIICFFLDFFYVKQKGFIIPFNSSTGLFEFFRFVFCFCIFQVVCSRDYNRHLQCITIYFTLKLDYFQGGVPRRWSRKALSSPPPMGTLKLQLFTE